MSELTTSTSNDSAGTVSGGRAPRGGSWKRKAFWILFVFALAFFPGYYFCRTYEKSEGTRTGTLYKVSRKGYVFKTYEGELLLAGSAIMSQKSVWPFSIKDKEVYDKLQTLDGQQVQLHYKELISPFIWQGETNFIVYKVDRANIQSAVDPNNGVVPVPPAPVPSPTVVPPATNVAPPAETAPVTP